MNSKIQNIIKMMSESIFKSDIISAIKKYDHFHISTNCLQPTFFPKKNHTIRSGSQNQQTKTDLIDNKTAN